MIADLHFDLDPAVPSTTTASEPTLQLNLIAIRDQEYTLSFRMSQSDYEALKTQLQTLGDVTQTDPLQVYHEGSDTLFYLQVMDGEVSNPGSVMALVHDLINDDNTDSWGHLD